MTAVRFLDFLLEETEPVALLTPAGVLAHVPSPARYAVHKLVTSQRRPAAESGKAKKDRRQAELLLALLGCEPPADVRDAFAAARRQPATFGQQLRAALGHLPHDLVAALPVDWRRVTKR